MISQKYGLFLVFTVLKTSRSLEVGESCILKASESPGNCKLFTDCSDVKNDFIKHNNLPQICGFLGNQPIVCCAKGTQPGEISKLKCKKYASYTYSNGSKSECGQDRIDGVTASRKEFPHMALLGYEDERGNISWRCGGSLISESYILTAAHCLLNPFGQTLKVSLGGIDINDKDDRQQIKVSQVILHPDFRVSSVYNDIGLVKLEQPVNLNPYVRPACLHTTEEISTEKAIATGWEVTSFGGPPSEIFRKVSLNLLEIDFCKNFYPSSRKMFRGIVKDTQICAGSNDNQKDTCQGDMEGPLQIYHDGDDVDCMYDIIGMRSYGKGCGSSPSVYTRVSHYIKWIEDTVWPKTM